MKIGVNLHRTNNETDSVQVDITEPKHGVQVEASADGSRLWVNVDGICVLRIDKIPKLTWSHS